MDATLTNESSRDELPVTEEKSGSPDRRTEVAKNAFASRIAVSVGACAAGALSLGALSVGAVAIARLAIRRAAIESLRIGRLEVDELLVSGRRIR